MNKEKFSFHIKECKFIFNCGLSNENIYLIFYKSLLEYVKFFSYFVINPKINYKKIFYILQLKFNIFYIFLFCCFF